MAKSSVKSKPAAGSKPLTVTGAKAKTRPLPPVEALGETQSQDLLALSAEFDSLLDRMQTPAARKALKSAFAATPKTLGRLAATRRRG